jgi:flagellar biosynthesis GTPase FlhF
VLSSHTDISNLKQNRQHARILTSQQATSLKTRAVAHSLAMALANDSKEDDGVVGQQIAAVDVEKAELGSNTDASTDVPLNHNKLDQNRFSITNAVNLSLDDVEPTDVQIRGLSIAVDTSPSWLDPSTYPELFSAKSKAAPHIKTLLHSVDASLKPGTLTAIIGGSGSGKTTLLNNLAERVVSSRLSQQGRCKQCSTCLCHATRYPIADSNCSGNIEILS